MSKKMTDKDGKVYVEQKPFYKRVWFWIVIAILVIVVGGAIGGGSNDDSSSSSDKTESTSSKSESKKSSNKPKISAEFTAALGSAETYAQDMHMSKAAIYDQLISKSGDKFPEDAAKYAVDHVKADWKKNALESAKTYQKDMNMSTAEIKDQLTSDSGDKFTPEEAQYAVDNLSK